MHIASMLIWTDRITVPVKSQVNLKLVVMFSSVRIDIYSHDYCSIQLEIIVYFGVDLCYTLLKKVLEDIRYATLYGDLN